VSGVSCASVTSKLTPDSVVTYLFHDQCSLKRDCWCNLLGLSASDFVCHTLCTLTPDKLSAVSYDPLTHSRYNAGYRSVKAGHEIMMN